MYGFLLRSFKDNLLLKIGIDGVLVLVEGVFSLLLPQFCEGLDHERLLVVSEPIFTPVVLNL